MRSLLAALALFGALGLGPARSDATTTVPITLEDLTRTSDEVFVGVVRQSHSRWDGGMIVTDTEVEVTTPLRGRLVPHATVVVRTPGGVVGRIGQTIHGVPVFEPGEAVLLFLQHGVSGLRYLTHLTASAVPITVGARGGLTAMAPEDLLGVARPAGPRTAPAAVDLAPIVAGVRAVAP